MFDSTQMIRGEVVFYKRDGFSILYKLEFANAHILGLVEEFDANGSVPLQFSIKIGWAIVRIKGITYQEYWNLDDPFEEVEATVIEEPEKKILRSYLINAAGDEIDSYGIGEMITLCLETENRIGEDMILNIMEYI